MSKELTDNDVFGLTTNPVLIQQITVEVCKLAKYLVGGGTPVPTVAQLTHAQYAALDPARDIIGFIWAVALDATVQSDFGANGVVTDGHVQFVIQQQWQSIWGS